MDCSDLEDFSRSLLKIVNVNLAMKLESSFVCSWSQNGIYIVQIDCFLAVV